MEFLPAFNNFTEDEQLDYLRDLLVKITIETKNYDQLLVIVQFLFQGLVSSSTEVRRASSVCLKQVVKHSEDRSTLSAILKPQKELLLVLLDDDDEEVIAPIVDVVKELGSPDTFGPKLLPLITRPYSPDVKVSNIAIEALSELGYKPVILHFRQLLQKTSDVERRYVILNALFNNREKFGLHQVEEVIKEFFLNDPHMGLMPKIMLESIDEEIGKS